MTDRENNRGACTVDASKIVGKGENRPVILDGTEVGVLCVWEATSVDELGTDSNISPRLECSTDRLEGVIQVQV
jgi:hypothetical protein